MKIKFLKNIPACYIPKIKSLIIADLHIGLEFELEKNGIKVFQKDFFREEILKILKETKAKRLIVLGDLKHEIHKIGIKEYKELFVFLEEIKKTCITKIIKGNHDGKIEKIFNSKFFPSKGFKLKEFYFCHGNSLPFKNFTKCKMLFFGHIHPTIVFKESFGKKRVEKVWVIGNFNLKKVKETYKVKKIGLKKFILLPSFNPLIYGRNILEIDKKLCPLISKKILDWENSKVYLLDGSYLGKISEIS